MAKQSQLKFEIKKDEIKIVPENNKNKAQSFSARENANTKIKNSGWFKLDNAALVYPGSKNETWTFVFRVSAVLKNEVDFDALQKSVDEIMPRFPTFDVCMKNGIFWHYFEPNPNRLLVSEEKDFPCSNMAMGAGKEHLIRVLYSKYRISVEVFHAITDGHGATKFLISLLARYFENIGVKIAQNDIALSYKDLPMQEEVEDSFVENVSGNKGTRYKEKLAYNIRGTVEDEGIVNTTNAIMSVKNLKEVAKSHNASITTFLAGVMCYEILKRRRNSNRPIKISIPIDMRKEFNSKTLRNFSTYINIAVSDEKLSLNEVIALIKTGLDGVKREFMQKNINSNVALQKNLFIKLLPLPVKDFAISKSFNILGEDLQTFAFSNFGKTEVPSEFYDLIERFEVNLGRSKNNSISVSAISFDDSLVLTISSKLVENTTERDIIRKLAELGVKIKVESNRRDSYGG